jgi:hypothetical protein
LALLALLGAAVGCSGGKPTTEISHNPDATSPQSGPKTPELPRPPGDKMPPGFRGRRDAGG